MKKAALKSGLSFLEIIIVILLIGLIILVSTPYLFGHKDKNDLIKEANMVAEHLRLSQQKSIAAEKGYDYGIRFEQAANRYVLLPEAIEHKVIELKKTISIDSVNPQEIIFTKLTGRPSSSLTIVLKSKGYQSKIEVNQLGVVIEYPIEKI